MLAMLFVMFLWMKVHPPSEVERECVGSPVAQLRTCVWCWNVRTNYPPENRGPDYARYCEYR